jgi:hypothetical protein
MKVKKYILIITLVLMIGFSYAGSAFACSDGGGGGLPPPDTASNQIESPAI